jgi:hypothetical protein
MHTVADLINPWFVLSLGAIATAGLFFIIVLIEALVLRGLKWGSFRLSFVDSFVINLTSATIGGLLFVLFAAAGALNLGVVPLFLLFGALTVLIEGAMLTVLKRHPLRQTWTAAVAINVASYASLFVLVVALKLSLA